MNSGHNRVIPIANQDAIGLPLYAGRPVTLTGERKGDAIFVTKVEAILTHLHIGHMMTNRRDTPGARGFLPVAVDEARRRPAGQLAEKGARQSRLIEPISLSAYGFCHGLDGADRTAPIPMPATRWRNASP